LTGLHAVSPLNASSAEEAEEKKKNEERHLHGEGISRKRSSKFGSSAPSSRDERHQKNTKESTVVALHGWVLRGTSSSREDCSELLFTWFHQLKKLEEEHSSLLKCQRKQTYRVGRQLWGLNTITIQLLNTNYNTNTITNEMKRTQSIEWWNENENTAFAHLSLVCASDEPLCSPPILLSD
jgi:hypothetical protein